MNPYPGAYLRIRPIAGTSGYRLSPMKRQPPAAPPTLPLDCGHCGWRNYPQPIPQPSAANTAPTMLITWRVDSCANCGHTLTAATG